MIASNDCCLQSAPLAVKLRKMVMVISLHHTSLHASITIVSFPTVGVCSLLEWRMRRDTQAKNPAATGLKTRGDDCIFGSLRVGPCPLYDTYNSSNLGIYPPTQLVGTLIGSV